MTESLFPATRRVIAEFRAKDEPHATFVEAGNAIVAALCNDDKALDRALRAMDTAPREYLIEALEADRLID